MESRFTVSGRRMVATTEQVERALRDVTPKKIRVHGVEIGARVYPVRQALAVACGLDPKECFPHVASRVFRQLGFRVFARPRRPRRKITRRELTEALPHRGVEFGPVEFERLDLPPLTLLWYRWERWEDLVEYGSAIVILPSRKCGVYEVKLAGSEERLAIGRAANLRSRILHGLVWGTSEHTAGRKIRENEDLSRLYVRWAVTDRPAAAEEELHRRHLEKFGRLPKYTLRT
jgi:hypothetical protein